MEDRVRQVFVTAKGELALEQDVLRHLGIAPGQHIELETLPGGEVRLRAVQRTGTIERFFHTLNGRTARSEPLSLEDMENVIATGWAGQTDAR